MLLSIMQCTDAKVNQVTPQLFGRWPDAAAMSKAEVRKGGRIVKCALASSLIYNSTVAL